MAKTTVKKAQKKPAKKAAKKATKKRGSKKKAQQPEPQGPPKSLEQAEAFIEQYGLDDLCPEAAKALREADYTE